MSGGVERVDGLAVYRRDATVAHRTWLPVVTVHGAMDRAAAFAHLSRRLPDRTVVRYDRRGYGRSSAQAPAADLDASVADLVGVVGGRRCVVVGHSMGGLIALALAHRRPDLVAAVVALEAPMPWEPWYGPAAAPGTDRGPVGSPAEDPAEAAEAFLRRVLGDVGWERLPPSARRSRRAEGAALLADLRAAAAGRPYDPDALEPPVIVGMGADTSDRHRRACRELETSVVDAERITVPGAGHGLHASHPDAVAAMVRRALARAEGATGPGGEVPDPHR